MILADVTLKVGVNRGKEQFKMAQFLPPEYN